MSFHVGQKVVCVDAAPHGVWLCGEELVKGAIYTIRAIGPSFGETAVQLEEVTRITDSIFSRPGVWGYAVRRFRPLTDTKTSTRFTTGADPDSDKWDNRKRSRERV